MHACVCVCVWRGSAVHVPRVATASVALTAEQSSRPAAQVEDEASVKSEQWPSAVWQGPVDPARQTPHAASPTAATATPPKNSNPQPSSKENIETDKHKHCNPTGREDDRHSIDASGWDGKLPKRRYIAAGHNDRDTQLQRQGVGDDAERTKRGAGVADG